MNAYSLSHVPDCILKRELPEAYAHERGKIIRVLVLIAEWHARGLYLEERYPSMFKYCVGALHMSEDEASKRIRIARAGREFPGVFAAIAEGRLHMTGALLLAPHLTAENVAGLLEAAAHRTKEEIELLLAHRFPRQDVPERVQPISAPAEPQQVAPLPAPERAASDIPRGDAIPAGLPAPERVPTPPVQPPSPPARVTPLAPERFGVQFTMGQGGRDDLRAIQDLLGHQVQKRNVADIFEAGLKHYRAHLEKRKFGGNSPPRRSKRPVKEGSRYIPVHIRRAVWERDGGRCTFVSKDGHRCEERSMLEFDHVNEFARGGEATIAAMRLLCRAHNQYAAECTYGAPFMREKREGAHRADAR